MHVDRSNLLTPPAPTPQCKGYMTYSTQVYTHVFQVRAGAAFPVLLSDFYINVGS